MSQAEIHTHIIAFIDEPRSVDQNYTRSIKKLETYTLREDALQMKMSTVISPTHRKVFETQSPM